MAMCVGALRASRAASTIATQHACARSGFDVTAGWVFKTVDERYILTMLEHVDRTKILCGSATASKHARIRRDAHPRCSIVGAEPKLGIGMRVSVET